jgi:hypothetical protein
MIRKTEIKIFRKWIKSKAGTKVNKSLRELAKRFYICTHSVRRILKEFNIKSKGRVLKQFCKNGHDTLKVGKITRMCIKCRELYVKQYIRKNKKKMKIYRKRYDKLNKRKIKLKKRRYYFIHKNKILKVHKAWKQKNKKKITRDARDYVRRKIKLDLAFKLKCILRTRLYCSIRDIYKSGSAIKDLGCSMEFFIAYIQEKFYGKMTWNNYGSYWQLDHIKELWEFDLTKRSQFKKAVHFTNLQPLTIQDHKKKSAKGAAKRSKKLND